MGANFLKRSLNALNIPISIGKEAVSSLRIMAVYQAVILQPDEKDMGHWNKNYEFSYLFALYIFS